MLVLATFLSICAVAVAFLLRFLFALESELRAKGERSGAVVRIPTLGVPTWAEAAVGPAPALNLVYANSRLARSSRPAASAAGQFKKQA